MPENEALRFSLLVALLALVSTLAIMALDRVLPDPSIECIKAGGSWDAERGLGHCERVKP